MGWYPKGRRLVGRTRMLSASAKSNDLVNFCANSRWLLGPYVLGITQLTPRPLLSYACRNLAARIAISSAKMAPAQMKRGIHGDNARPQPVRGAGIQATLVRAPG